MAKRALLLFLISSLCFALPPLEDIRAKLIQKNKGVNLEPGKLAFRVLRTQTEFTRLSDDPGREAAFLVPFEELAKLKALSGQELLKMLGYTADYLASLKGNTKLALLVLKKPEGFDIATWDQVNEIVADRYPPRVAQAVSFHLRSLRTTPFVKIEGSRPISQAKKRPATFVSAEKLVSIARPSLWDVRAFLHHSVGLTDLFTGNGLTSSPDGKTGVVELIGPNLKLSEIPVSILIPIEF